MSQKYYAKEDKLSTSPLDGGIEITEAAYLAAIEHKRTGVAVVRAEGLRLLSNNMITIWNESRETQKIPDNEDVPEGWTTAAPKRFDELVDGVWVENESLRAQTLTAEIKLEASRRIQASGHDWMAHRKISTGVDIPQTILDYAEAVRLACDALEVSLPDDYADDSYWPEVPA